MTDRKRVGP